MKVFGAACFTAMAGLSLVFNVSTAYGDMLTPGQGPSAPDSFSMSCASCVILDSVSGTGSTSDLGFVYAAAVITDDPNNPFGLNALDFVYSVVNDATSADAISRITATDFAGFSTDVGYFTSSVFPGGTVAPDTVDRNSADTVGFSFNSLGGGGPIQPGDESLVLVIMTNATTFNTAGTMNISDGSVASEGAFAPTPEPSFVWLLGGALLAMAALQWLRVSKAHRN